MGLLTKAVLASASKKPEEAPDINNTGLDRAVLQEKPEKEEKGRVPRNPLEAALNRYYKLNRSFNGILATAPEDSTVKEKTEFFQKLLSVVSSFGMMIPLPAADSGKNLIIFPQSVDRELITHRLKTSFNISIPLFFDAASPGDVLEKVRPFQEDAAGE